MGGECHASEQVYFSVSLKATQSMADSWKINSDHKCLPPQHLSDKGRFSQARTVSQGPVHKQRNCQYNALLIKSKDRCRQTHS